MMVTVIRIGFLKHSIVKTLDKEYPSVRIGLSNFNSGLDLINQKRRISLFTKALFSFGSNENSREMMNYYFDVKAIEKLDDKKLNQDLDRLTDLVSLNMRLWTIVFFIPLIGVIFWDK
jgi:hypothetical protein